MTRASTGGRILADAIASAYVKNSNVQAVMVGGSVSRGCADQFSDLELGVFWDVLPSADERKLLAMEVGGELSVFDRTPGHEFYLLHEIAMGGQQFSGTVLVSVHHMRGSEVDDVIREVLEKYDSSPAKQAFISALLDCSPIYGHEILIDWKTRAEAYPEPLAIKVIQENLWFGPWFIPEAYIARDDTLVLHQHFVWIGQCVLKVLAALNRIYYPSPEHKWMHHLIEKMQVTPAGLSERLKRAFQSDPRDAWRELRDLMLETLDLVELHLPDVNKVPMFTEHPEANTGWARKRWEKYPPYTLMLALGSQN